MLLTTSYWLLIGFFLAGILHNLLSPESLQKNLGNTKFSSLLKATISGLLLPICSCGVVPVAVSLYYSGAYLGPVLAFLVATPIINPAAVLLSYAFLGPQITGLYILAGITIPFIAGFLGNVWGKKKLFISGAPAGSLPPVTAVPVSLQKKLLSGVRWGIFSLGQEVSKYVVPGIILAAGILTFLPTAWIQKYLSDPQLFSVLVVAVLGAVMYVCAVGHIPFIAAFIAAGAAPGVALTFLLAGVATNLPEMISLAKLIGKRSVAIYTGVVVGAGVLFGYAANWLLLPDFIPVFDVSVNSGIIQMAAHLNFEPPYWFKAGTALLLLSLFAYSYIWPLVKKSLNFIYSIKHS